MFDYLFYRAVLDSYTEQGLETLLRKKPKKLTVSVSALAQRASWDSERGEKNSKSRNVTLHIGVSIDAFIVRHTY